MAEEMPPNEEPTGTPMPSTEQNDPHAVSAPPASMEVSEAAVPAPAPQAQDTHMPSDQGGAIPNDAHYPTSNSAAIPDQGPGGGPGPALGQDQGPGPDQGPGQGMAPNNLIGSAHIRPIFLGNLDINVTAEDVSDIFTRPYSDMPPMPVERVDLKRGFAFVFMDPAKSEEDKARVETYVERINGMEFPNISKAVRAEFARGDGRVKRKEDDRRKIITPNETLFVVNFSEETTKKEDLEMLFSKFGDLVRIDMKRNYAFVQYTTTEDATKAKDATNGGQLDQNVITVEYVAQRRRDDDRRGGYRGDRDRGYRGGRNDYRGGRRGYDRDYDRRRSPPRGRYDDDRRYRSRSRSPLRNRSRSRSPLGGGRRYRDDRGRDNKFDSRDPPRNGGRDNDARGYR